MHHPDLAQRAKNIVDGVFNRLDRERKRVPLATSSSLNQIPHLMWENPGDSEKEEEEAQLPHSFAAAGEAGYSQGQSQSKNDVSQHFFRDSGSLQLDEDDVWSHLQIPNKNAPRRRFQLDFPKNTAETVEDYNASLEDEVSYPDSFELHEAALVN